MALANPIEGLRQEVTRFIERARAIEVTVLEEALGRVPRSGRLGASGLAITITSLALLLSRENQLGMDAGPAEIRAALAVFRDELEPL